MHSLIGAKFSKGARWFLGWTPGALFDVCVTASATKCKVTVEA